MSSILCPFTIISKFNKTKNEKSATQWIALFLFYLKKFFDLAYGSESCGLNLQNFAA